MVRRVVGASSAPTPDFSPYKAVTPAAGMTDFYRQPGTMAIPESEFSQVASALQSISPTLSKVIGDQAEAANQTAADQGRIDAEKLDAEQAREAMRGNFRNLEKSGKIPVGASPFRLAAMQASLGKQAIQNDLRSILNENIGRFTDPYSKEDPAAFVQEQFAKIVEDRGMDFYAKGAATEALDQVESAFLNRASLMKSENRAEQGRKDLTSDTFVGLRQPTPPEVKNAAEATQYYRGNLQKLVDEFYKTTGESGRPQVLMGLKAAAKSFADAGDREQADALIDAAEGVKIGGQKLGESESIAFQNLREEVHDRADRAEAKEDTDRDRAIKNRSVAVNNEASRLYSEYLGMGPDAFRKADFGSRKDELKSRLMDNEKLDEDDAELAVAELVRRLESQQRQEELDPETMANVLKVINDDKVPFETKMTILSENMAALGEQFTPLYNSVTTKNSENRAFQAFYNATTSDRNTYINDVAVQAEKAGITGSRLLSLRDGIRARVEQVARDVSGMELTDAAKREEFRKRAEKIRDEAVEILEKEERPEEPLSIPADAPPDVRDAMIRERMTTAEGQESPLPKAETSWYVDDSDATINMEVLQNAKDYGPESVKKAKSTIYKDSLAEEQKALKGKIQFDQMLRRNRAFDVFGIASYDTEFPFTKEYLRLRSVTGFSLEEIRSNEVLKTGEGLGITIPPKVLNPKHVMLIRNMRSAKALEIYAQTEEGEAKIIEIMKSLPKDYRFIPKDHTGPLTGQLQDAFYKFVEQQIEILERYRPTQEAK